MTSFDLNFPRAFGAPVGTAGFRVANEDFFVDEALGFVPEGAGEHVLLQLEKSGDNTPWLARQIARLAGVESRDVGYCGLKDRHGVTRQWFSVYLPKGDEPDWSALNSDTVTLLQSARHRQKLRRGQHQCNRFRIRLRDIDGERSALDEKLSRIAERGVPNYFGEQRFGLDGGNLEAAERMLVAGSKIKNREKRSMVLSAARSWLFNQVLAARVVRGDWAQRLPGDPLEGVYPSGPLWGRGRSLASDDTRQLETEVLNTWQSWCEPLEFTGLTQQRRSLVNVPEALSWAYDGADLELRFSLTTGAYATALVRELVHPRSGT